MGNHAICRNDYRIKWTIRTLYLFSYVRTLPYTHDTEVWFGDPEGNIEHLKRVRRPYEWNT